MRLLARIIRQYSIKSKIPRPRDPTVAESFETKLSDTEIQLLLDPKGFMSQQQKLRQQMNKPKQQNIDKPNIINQKKMEPQYGFTPKGPQPTRYGDWEVKGKCVDF